MDIKAVANYDAMTCSLFFDDELIKKFNMNKGDVGKMWGYFMYQPEEAPKQLKYHVILELVNKAGIPLDTPKLFIYPKFGAYVIGDQDYISVEVEGDYETYLDNHKHHTKEDES